MNLGSFGEAAQDIGKRISKFKPADFYATYLKQDGAELANVARETMKKNLDASSMVNRTHLQDFINNSPNSIKGDRDYINATKGLIKSLDSKDMEQANDIARKISDNYKENSYLDLLKGAENKKSSLLESYNSMNEEDIADVFREKIKTPKSLDNFMDDTDKEKVKGLAYSLQGKKKYFSSDNVKTNKVRAGVAAGVYAGTMTTARLAHGGSLTENEYGERDIVGIPFV